LRITVCFHKFNNLRRYVSAMAFPLFMMTAMGAVDVGDHAGKRGTRQVRLGEGGVTDLLLLYLM
jgi:hypothetical protein